MLKKQGLRCTTQRIAVVELLASQAAPGHLSAPEIHTRLHDAGPTVNDGHEAHDGPAMDATTVYRTVSTLLGIGFLHATAFADQPCSYGIATTPHHHAVCTRCGQLREVPAAPLRAALRQAANSSRYQWTDCSLLLQGICPTCRVGRTSARVFAPTQTSTMRESASE